VKDSNYNKSTLSVHAGEKSDNIGVVNSVHPSTAYRYIDHGEQLYPRYFNTPNQRVVVEQIVALEKAEAGLIFGSGMAAVTTTLLSLLKRGDHIVLQQALYGGTHAWVVDEFQEAGISYTFADCNAESLMSAVESNTRVIYTETPANPLLEVIDLQAVANSARERNIITVVDNTFASPINQNPIPLGFDVVLHSGTKYLGGHSDLSFGAVVASQSIIERIRKKAVHYGGIVNAFTCYLIERSIKTLSVRVQQQNQNAQQIAEFLAAHSGVEAVYYPGLESHPGHSIAASQMSGFGGMVSFSLSQSLSPTALLSELQLIAAAMSLGSVESTITIPSLTSHKPMPADERKKLGISDQLIRLSVGIESADDLISDLENALAKSKK